MKVLETDTGVRVSRSEYSDTKGLFFAKDKTKQMTSLSWDRMWVPQKQVTRFPAS